MIGPEFGTVARADLAAAAREAGEAGFDVLVACAFNFDAHSTDALILAGNRVFLRTSKVRHDRKQNDRAGDN